MYTFLLYLLYLAELHTLVTDLGGSFKWTFDATCTHYIYQGKRGDISKVKELKSIKGKECCVVSPHWIYSVSVCVHVLCPVTVIAKTCQAPSQISYQSYCV